MFFASQEITLEQFNKLPVKQRRLIVIMDALDSVVNSIANPTPGRYIDNVSIPYYCSIKKEPTAKCDICLMAGILISVCRITNDLTYGEANDTLYNQGEYKPFNKLFEKEQMYLMECCFEGDSSYSSMRYAKSYELENKYNYSLIFAKYVKTFPDRTDRFVAILHNMLRNDGIFIPEQDIAEIL